MRVFDSENVLIKVNLPVTDGKGRTGKVNYIISNDLVYVNWITVNGTFINDFEEINPNNLFVL
jgi:hypothetical protein